MYQYDEYDEMVAIQYNWFKLEEAPDILEELATVRMHAIQTSGNCVRNITTEQFAGVAAELVKKWGQLQDGPATLTEQEHARVRCICDSARQGHPG